MVMGEFMTACKYDLPINLFLMDNRQLGMIMQEQKVEKLSQLAGLTFTTAILQSMQKAVVVLE